MWKYIVVLLLVAVCVCAEARRGNRGRGRGGGGRRGGQGRPAARGRIPPEAETLAEWDRVLTGDVTASESAYKIADQFYVISVDRRTLKTNGFKPSRSLYDFSGGSPPVAVLKVKKRCYKLDVPQDLTNDSLAAQISNYNGMRRSESPMEQVYATSLTDEENLRVGGNSAVSALCADKPIFGLTTVTPQSQGGRRKTLRVTTLDSFLSITVIKKNKGGRGAGGAAGGAGRRAGGRKGRRGGAGRRRNRGGRGGAGVN